MSDSIIACEEDSTAIFNYETRIPTLSNLEQEIADGLKQSRDLGINAVTRAYDLYNGDFAAFNKGACFKYMDRQLCLETIMDYDFKSQEMGMSALELSSTTEKTLESKLELAGRTDLKSVLWKLKRAIEKRIERKRKTYAGILQNYWVCNISYKSCQECDIIYSYDRISLNKVLRNQRSSKKFVYRTN